MAKLKSFICILLILFCFDSASLRVSADIGPKPSVHITFDTDITEPCFGTLLSLYPSTGPNSVYREGEDEPLHNGREEGAYLCYGEDVWRAFVDYEDPDGFYFLQGAVWDVEKSGEIHWGYYPPQTFKILLYYPNTGTFVCSETLQRYAFDTYYAVRMSGTEIDGAEYDEAASSDRRIHAYRSYEVRTELLAFACRALLTVAIEVAIALLFGFRSRTALLLLTAVNLVTQVLLNAALFSIRFFEGDLMFLLATVLLEMAVIVIESVAYFCWRKKIDSRARGGLCILYAVAANAASWLIGSAVIGHLIPSIF